MIVIYPYGSSLDVAGNSVCPVKIIGPYPCSQAGTVWINDYHLLSAAAPRGGFKMSGIGRELGLEGIYEFTQTRVTFFKFFDAFSITLLPVFVDPVKLIMFIFLFSIK